jgi:hypothetical protein
MKRGERKMKIPSITKSNGFEVGKRIMVLYKDDFVEIFRLASLDVKIDEVFGNKLLSILVYSSNKKGTSYHDILEEDAELYPIDSPLFQYWNPFCKDKHNNEVMCVIEPFYSNADRQFKRLVSYFSESEREIEFLRQGLEVYLRPDWF